MNNALIRSEMSVADIQQVAEMVASSKMFPGWDSKEKIMTLMMIAQSEGVPAIAALNRYDMIQGRISKKSQACLSDFIAQGGKVEWLKSDNESAKAKFTTPAGVEHIEDFCIEDARRAELVKPHSNWTKYPKSMLRARCIAFGLRAVYPQALNMMLSTEEAQDFAPMKNVTPPEAQTPLIAETVQEVKAEIVQPPAEPEKKKEVKKATKKAEKAEKESTVQEFLTSLDPEKLKAFLISVNWGAPDKLSPVQLEHINDNRIGFAKKVNEVKL